MDPCQGCSVVRDRATQTHQNAYIESFDRHFRGECLNDRWFNSLMHARVAVEAWRRAYNEEQPKKSLGELTPAAHAKQLRQNQSINPGL